MTVRRLLGAVVVSGALSTVLLGTAGTALAQDSANLTASGSGAEEVPAGSGEEGTTTTGSFQVDAAGSLTYTVSVTGNSEELTMGHIHEGAAGVNGGVVIQLDPAAITAGTSATVEVDPALAAEIIADPAGFYLNTHSASFAAPTGVARAQLTAGSTAPSTIDTGTGGQAAVGTGSSTSYVLGGVALVAVAGGALAVARRRGDASS